MNKWLISALLLTTAAAAKAETDWRLTDVRGEKQLVSQELSDGRVRILIFWATWCPYCKALLPHLQSIADEYGPRVSVAAVNFRDDGDPAAYFSERGYTFALFLEGDAVATAYGVKATPGLLILDGKGDVAFNLYDFMPEARKRLESRDASLPNWQKASRLTPLWAAEVRRRLDATLSAP